MNKNKTLWAVVAVIIIIGGLVFVRQWKMDNIVSGLDNELVNGLLEEPETVGGTTYLVPSNYVFDSGADLPALTDPNYTNVTDADSYLSDEVYGIDLEIEGQRHFYSYQILNWHEVVNETVGDSVIAVTHCTLCGVSSVFQSEDTFAHAGKIYNNNELLADSSTDSYWNQMTGMAIVGERAGETLEKVDYTIMTWGDWKDLYPRGSVLSNETGYDRDYGRHPFESYDIAEIVYFPLNQIEEQMSAKWVVDGLTFNDSEVAFAQDIMKGTWILNFEIDEVALVAFYDVEEEITRIFEAGDYIFDYDPDLDVFIDQDGTSWSAEGLAASGVQMSQVSAQRSFAMCWFANHSNSAIALIDLQDKTTETPEDEEGSGE
ncbi:DUF3179 domain-containing protein [Candidatus Uhrbacteria bacterium]|jgi:hypothetical protein|nr:DUF3179 domain-containing protein [Candidatus Uhrbacteria bacterium]